MDAETFYETMTKGSQKQSSKTLAQLREEANEAESEYWQFERHAIHELYEAHSGFSCTLSPSIITYMKEQVGATDDWTIEKLFDAMSKGVDFYFHQGQDAFQNAYHDVARKCPTFHGQEIAQGICAGLCKCFQLSKDRTVLIKLFQENALQTACTFITPEVITWQLSQTPKDKTPKAAWQLLEGCFQVKKYKGPRKWRSILLYLRDKHGDRSGLAELVEMALVPGSDVEGILQKICRICWADPALLKKEQKEFEELPDRTGLPGLIELATALPVEGEGWKKKLLALAEMEEFGEHADLLRMAAKELLHGFECDELADVILNQVAFHYEEDDTEGAWVPWTTVLLSTCDVDTPSRDWRTVLTVLKGHLAKKHETVPLLETLLKGEAAPSESDMKNLYAVCFDKNLIRGQSGSREVEDDFPLEDSDEKQPDPERPHPVSRAVVSTQQKREATSCASFVALLADAISLACAGVKESGLWVCDWVVQLSGDDGGHVCDLQITKVQDNEFVVFFFDPNSGASRCKVTGVDAPTLMGTPAFRLNAARLYNEALPWVLVGSLSI